MSSDAPAGAVRWTAVEILGGLFLAFSVTLLLGSVLDSAGFYAWYYGPEQVAVAKNPQSPPLERRLAQVRMMLWPACLAFPLQLWVVFLVLDRVSGTRPTDLGLTTDRLGRNALLGLGTGLWLIPLVYGLQALSLYLDRAWRTTPPQEHPFTLLGQQGSLTPVEWGLLLFAAVVVAPVWEEVFFRGLLQPWFLARPGGGLLALGVALGLTLLRRWDTLVAALHEGGRPVLEESAPFLALLAALAVYLALWARAGTAAGLFASAVLFGWVHVSVWPTPVPLTVLGLGLGVLAYRTGSLVGPIVLHALFNAVAAALLIAKVHTAS